MDDNYRKIWSEESYEYFKRNYEEENLRTLKPNHQLKSAIKKSNLEIPEGSSVLDIGCSSGNNLLWLKNKFNVFKHS